MDIKESNIYFDEKKQMYKVDLGFNSRFFDFLLYTKNGLVRKFGKENISINNSKKMLEDTPFYVSGNYIFGCSEVFGYKIINILNLDTTENIYKLVKDVNLFNFQVQGKYFYILVFVNKDDNIGYFTDFKKPDFEIKIENDILSITNTILGILIYSKKIEFKINGITNLTSLQGQSCVDFYYFKNILTKDDYNKFLSEIESIFVNLPIKTENKFQTKIYYLQTENLQIIKEFKKIVLTLPFNQFLYYSTEKFKDEFNEIERATSIDINKLNLDFKITTEINTYDEDYLKFQKNMIKLQYILYSLKISLEKIKQQNIDNLNPHFQFLSQRISITKENLERNILYYEKIYKNFVENIKLI